MSMGVKLWEEVNQFKLSVDLNNPNSHRSREERRRVERSITGQMALLGLSDDGANEEGI